MTDNTSDVLADTFPHDIAGRTIVCRYLSDGQRMVFTRLLDRWRIDVADDGNVTAEQQAEMFHKMNTATLDLIESLIVNPADVSFLEQQMLVGKVGLKDLSAILAGGKQTVAEPVADDVPVKKAAAKRAAPRKAAKKAAAKK